MNNHNSMSGTDSQGSSMQIIPYHHLGWRPIDPQVEGRGVHSSGFTGEKQQLVAEQPNLGSQCSPKTWALATTTGRWKVVGTKVIRHDEITVLPLKRRQPVEKSRARKIFIQIDLRLNDCRAKRMWVYPEAWPWFMHLFLNHSLCKTRKVVKVSSYGRNEDSVTKVGVVENAVVRSGVTKNDDRKKGLYGEKGTRKEWTVIR